MQVKRFITIITVAATLCCFGCQASPEQPLIIATQQPRPEPTAAPTEEPQQLFPIMWNNEGWDDTADIMSVDLFGDGEAELIRYSGDENAPILNSDFYVNDASVGLEFYYPMSVAICDFDTADGCIDFLVCGDTGSSDYYTYQLRYDGTALTLVSDHFAWIHSVTENEIVMAEVVDMIGTWSTVRTYTVQDGVLTPSTEVLTNLETDMSEDAEYSRVLTLKKALPVTALDGTAIELAVGTRLIPVSFVRGEYVMIITDDGTEYRLNLDYSESEWEGLINGEVESEYFEGLMYAG
ncbi:MAG: hypothetical protein Q4C01_02425 [Clostridia bacterium]|nr:hypothetical protein [Clostridia bacterium]